MLKVVALLFVCRFVDQHLRDLFDGDRWFLHLECHEMLRDRLETFRSHRLQW